MSIKASRRLQAAREFAECLAAEVQYTKQSKPLPERVRNALERIAKSGIRPQTRDKARQLMTTGNE